MLLSIPSIAGTEESRDEILNPYYRQPRWRLWKEDSTPIKYGGVRSPHQPTEDTFVPTKIEKRRYPTFAGSEKTGVFPTLEHVDRQPLVAGFWDDCYVNMDFGHKRIPPYWAASGLSLGLAGQFIDVHPGMPDVATRMAFGANFTSQSFAGRGRHIVDDTVSNLEAEQDYFFANCVRATPANSSYQDSDPKQVHDAYDGLFAHSYQSIGASGSETFALTKMLIAGGSMPRSIKDLLKRHGAYAITLLTIFKAALPYSDERGNEVPYEHELRHRPAYSSQGDVYHIRFCGANPHYHEYDEAKHLQRMIDIARNMIVAPPVAIVKLVDITVTKDGQTTVDRSQTDRRIQTVCRTGVRIWGKRNETITARVDVRDSYDLQGRKLSFDWSGVYRNQRNVRIEPDGQPGLWRLTVSYDPKLPKGRIPVMLVARNGAGVPSNPAFVNFYWPERNERSDWDHLNPHQRGIPSGQRTAARDVTQNQRPLVEVDVDGDAVWARPGDVVRFSIQGEDPEGYPVTIYRRSGEVGSLRDGQFAWKVPVGAPSQVYPVHFIFSDGTGGYAGRRFKIIVNPELPVLPNGWQATTIGVPARAGMVRFEKDTFHLTGVLGQAQKKRSPDGIFVYRKASGDLDMVCRVENIEPSSADGDAPRIELMIREHLHKRGSHVAVVETGSAAEVEARVQFRTQPDWSRWTGSTSSNRIPLPARTPLSVRLMRRGDAYGGFVTSSGVWEQIGSIGGSTSGDVFAGVALVGGGSGVKADVTHPPQATVRWMRRPSISIPLITLEGKRLKSDDAFVDRVRLVPSRHDKGVQIVYTLDERDPDESSRRLRRPYLVNAPGAYKLRARLIDRGRLGDLIVHQFRVDAADKRPTP